MKIKLAEALLRRKELQEKVDRLRQIDQKELYEIRAKRVNVTDSIDDVTANVPKMTLAEFTRGFDYHAKHLRLVDAAIQQANWTTEIDVDDDSMKDYEPDAALSD
jgi:hypothetical protein